jgi:hypothetical protein
MMTPAPSRCSQHRRAGNDDSCKVGCVLGSAVQGDYRSRYATASFLRTQGPRERGMLLYDCLGPAIIKSSTRKEVHIRPLPACGFVKLDYQHHHLAEKVLNNVLIESENRNHDFVEGLQSSQYITASSHTMSLHCKRCHKPLLRV